MIRDCWNSRVVRGHSTSGGVAWQGKLRWLPAFIVIQYDLCISNSLTKWGLHGRPFIIFMLQIKGHSRNPPNNRTPKLPHYSHTIPNPLKYGNSYKNSLLIKFPSRLLSSFYCCAIIVCFFKELRRRPSKLYSSTPSMMVTRPLVMNPGCLHSRGHEMWQQTPLKIGRLKRSSSNHHFSGAICYFLIC